jgi:hypothetical protein
VGWVYKGHIPYMEKGGEGRMEVDTGSNRTDDPTTEQTPNVGSSGGGGDEASEGDPMVTTTTTTTKTSGCGGGVVDDASGVSGGSGGGGGGRELKRARSLEAGLTESQEMERRAQLSDEIQQAWQMLGLSAPGSEGSGQRRRKVDVEGHIERVGGPPEKQAGQFPFYSKQLFMMRGERLKEVVSSLVDEVRRERRNDEDVPLVGLIVERVKDEDGAPVGSAGGGLMREGEWRCARGRSEQQQQREGDDAGDCGCGAGECAGGAEHKEKGKNYMVGFYIPHMDKYAFGTDTLVFEMHVKVGGAHIPSSPFLLAFFNPLLP